MARRSNIHNLMGIYRCNVPDVIIEVFEVSNSQKQSVNKRLYINSPPALQAADLVDAKVRIIFELLLFFRTFAKNYNAYAADLQHIRSFNVEKQRRDCAVSA